MSARSAEEKAFDEVFACGCEYRANGARDRLCAAHRPSPALVDALGRATRALYDSYGAYSRPRVTIGLRTDDRRCARSRYAACIWVACNVVGNRDPLAAYGSSGADAGAKLARKLDRALGCVAAETQRRQRALRDALPKKAAP